MKLLELYSLSSGLKIGKPFIYKSYYPLPFEKYITIHASSGMESKNYSYWNDVLYLLKESLLSENIHVVQIGSNEDETLNVNYRLNGKTDINQTAHVLSNSMLHLCNDTFSSHVCAFYEVPLVCVYGPTTVENHSPFHFNRLKSVFISSNRNGLLPSYSSAESPKTVDFIKPEIVAESAASLLNINFRRVKSEFFGKEYPTNIIEYIPNFSLNPSFIGNGLVNIRMDYCFNEQKMSELLYSKKCNIISNKELDIKLIKVFRKNINRVSLEINENTSIDYIDNLKSTGIDLYLSTQITDAKQLADLRFKLLKFEVNQDLKSKKPLDFKEKACNNLLFKTNKFILSDNCIFLSKAHWKASLPSLDMIQNNGFVIDNEDFWQDSEYFYIYDEKI